MSGHNSMRSQLHIMHPQCSLNVHVVRTITLSSKLYRMYVLVS